MTTQKNLSAKQVNNGAKSLIALAQTLNQAIKCLNGIMGERLDGTAPEQVAPKKRAAAPEKSVTEMSVSELLARREESIQDAEPVVGPNLTVKEFLVELGVDVDKTIKVKHLKEAWADALLVEGKLGLYKNIPATITLTAELATQVGGKEGDEVHVYNEKGKKVYSKKVVAVGDNAWTARTIVDGLKQSYRIEKLTEQAEKIDVANVELSKVFIQKVTKVGKKTTISYVKVNKSDVVF